VKIYSLKNNNNSWPRKQPHQLQFNLKLSLGKKDLAFMPSPRLQCSSLLKIGKRAIEAKVEKDKRSMSTSEIEKIKSDILSNRCWIRSVVKSVKNQDQLESAEKLVNNWKSLTYKRIDSFKPSFFTFSSNSGWRSLLELFLRVEKDLESHLAGKKTLIKIKTQEEVYDYA